MIARVLAWLRRRSARERLLLSVAGALIFAIVLPLRAYSSALAFRAAAARDLDAAQELRAEVARLAQAGPSAGTPAGGDGSIRGRVTTIAEQQGLEISRIEPAGPDRVRVRFEPASSIRVYRWMHAVGRSGAFIASTAMIRTGEGDTVTAEFEVATGP
ncbi:MAG: hypothetical protein GC189_09415 [Alphaproteobacteria bacterium]|nr:hypothetical protein [Alphaproteobacteria bacterium]